MGKRYFSETENIMCKCVEEPVEDAQLAADNFVQL